MIPTLPLDMLLSLGLGMAFSLAQGDKEKDRSSVFVSAYFLVGLAFHLVMAFGVALVCYVLHPDWMWMYYTSHTAVPVALVVYIFSGYFAMYLLGFLLVPELRKVRRELPWAVFMALLLFIFIFIGLNFHRLWYVGEYSVYVADNAKAITGTSLLPILGISMPVAIGGLVIVILLLRRVFG